MKKFPTWRFGPGYTGPRADGSEDPAHARIFHRQEDIPEGWVDSPAAVRENADKVPEAVEPPPAPAPAANTPLKRNAKKASKDPARDAAIAKLLAAGYDPAELEKASQAQLDEAVKAIPNGSNGA